MILEAAGLRKAYGPVTAVADVSLSVSAGEVVGLLGPNGAGKTTTVAMICGLLSPDAGEVRIAGQALRGDEDPVKRRLGLVPQDLALTDALTARDNLRFFGALYGLTGPALAARIDAVLGFVGLRERAADRVDTYSGGMKRRLNIAAALLHEPDLLLLDEPTVGVDPQSRHAIFEALLALKAQGKAIVYTTHYMEEAERLCDRIVIVDHGRVVAADSLRGLLSRATAVNRLAVDLAADGDGAWAAELTALPGIRAAAVRGGVLQVSLEDLGRDTPTVLSALAARGQAWTHLSSERADLEAVFLALTGRSLRD